MRVRERGLWAGHGYAFQLQQRKGIVRHYTVSTPTALFQVRCACSAAVLASVRRLRQVQYCTLRMRMMRTYAYVVVHGSYEDQPLSPQLLRTLLCSIVMSGTIWDD